MASGRVKKISFTKHAYQKFEFLRKYGFDVSEASVRETVMNPSQTHRKDGQISALKPLDREYALRVVYNMVNADILPPLKGVGFPIRRRSSWCLILSGSRAVSEAAPGIERALSPVSLCCMLRCSLRCIHGRSCDIGICRRL